VIHKLEIENFMSLRDVSIELNPLTVFIGPNASGKSAIFKALVLLSKLLNGTPVRGIKGELVFLEPGVTLDDLVWAGDSGLPIRFRVWLTSTNEKPDYSLELRKRAEGWSVTSERIRKDDGGWIEVDEDTPFQHPTERRGTVTHKPPLRATLRYLVNPYSNDAAARPSIEPILQIASKFGHAWRYRPSAIDIAQFVKRPTEKGRAIYVAENGWGVAAVLQDLHNSPADRAVFENIEQSLRQLFPHIHNIGFENDYLGVRLSYRTDRSYEPVRASQESDGVLLATFLLWRLLTAGSDMAVCLEEPENGLHPVLLAARFSLLKKMATGGRQLLVSTHSPEFLRALKRHPSELYKEVRLVQPDPAAGTQVRSLVGMGEAKKLIDDYIDEMHERWTPVAEEWCK
jgi:predicted ATPase